MSSVIITTPQRGLDKGVISDSNYIEYPPNSGEEIVNLITQPDGVVERRPGLHIDTAGYKWTSATSAETYENIYYWEPSPGSRHTVRVQPNNLGAASVFVDDQEVMAGVFLGLGYSSNITFTRTYHTQNPPGTGPLVASSGSTWFNNVEYKTHTATVTSTALFAFPITFDQYYDKGGVRYIRRMVIDCTNTQLPAVRSVPEITQTVQFAASKNFLVITSPMALPVVIWKCDDNQFRGDVVDIGYRRYEDKEDGVSITAQPASSVSNAILEENLLNRGWTTAAISSYKSAVSKWPSKAMVPWKGKNSTGVFSATELDKVFFGSSSAALGAQVQSITEDRVTVPTATCSFGGRIWYAGFSGDKSNKFVAYTQTITSDTYPPTGVQKCYAFNDPTAEYFNQPTALDGGIIPVEGAKNISVIKPFKDGVVVFAENGVWMITGVQGQAFQGNAFDLYKLTDEGILCAGSVAVTEDFILYWTRTGVNRISANAQSRSLVVESITDGRLRDSFSALVSSFNETASFTEPGVIITYALSTRAHPAVWAAHDAVEKKVYFSFGQGVVSIFGAYTFNSSGPFAVSATSSYTASTTMWVYDYVKDAFFQYVLGTGPRLLSTDWTGRHVVIRNYVPYKFKGGATAAAGQFQDVATLTGAWPPAVATYTDYSSYAVISTKNALVDPDKQLHAVHLSFENSNYGTYPSNTDGSCYMSVIFDNYTAVNTLRTSPEQQAYRHVPGKVPDYSTGNYYRVVKTRLKVRGHGSHYRVKIRSESNKNFKLIGYALDVQYPATELRRISSGGGDE